MTKTSFRAFICSLGFLIDQYAVPLVIAYFLLEKCARVIRIYPDSLASFHRLFSNGYQIADGITVSGFLSEALVALYNAITLWAFLIRKKPKVKSETIGEVAIPIVTVAVYTSINLLGQVPASVNPLLYPEKIILPLSLIGSCIVFAGLTISAIAIFQLRYSIAVIVQVRDVVSHGFYRHVRHPIYLGYFIQMAGFLMTIPHVWTILWAVMAGCFFIIRARLEENKLAAHSAAYRDYMNRTPFLIPWQKKTV